MNMTNISESSPVTSGSGSFFSGTLFKAMVIIVILGLIGVNIFYYLGDVSEYMVELFEPLLKLFGYESSSVIKQTVKTSVVGTDNAVDIAATTLKRTLKLTERIVDETLPTNNTTMSQSKTGANNSHMNLNNRPTRENSIKAANEDSDGALVIDSVSSKSVSSIGFCYIGEDRGNRSCATVNDESNCMSGEIFPSRDVCINPNLRE